MLPGLDWKASPSSNVRASHARLRLGGRSGAAALAPSASSARHARGGRGAGGVAAALELLAACGGQRMRLSASRERFGSHGAGRAARGGIGSPAVVRILRSTPPSEDLGQGCPTELQKPSVDSATSMAPRVAPVSLASSSTRATRRGSCLQELPPPLPPRCAGARGAATLMGAKSRSSSMRPLEGEDGPPEWGARGRREARHRVPATTRRAVGTAF